MHLRHGFHSLEHIRRDQESRYLGRASLHDNWRKNFKSIYRTGTRRHIAQFPQMVGRFVIPTDDHCQDGCGGLALIIP